MIKAIFYKEWIKMRWFILAATVLVGGTSVYLMLRLAKVVSLKGAAHMWEVAILKDAVFINYLEFIPLIIGIGFALMQFMHEMNGKKIKLTLHLPHKYVSLISVMNLFGFLALSVVFFSAYAVLLLYLPQLFPVEIYSRIFAVSYPWFVAGFAGYLFTSFVVLEPTWRMRVLNIIVSIFYLLLFFLSDQPGAYGYFIAFLAVYTLCALCLSWLSVARFKEGAQD